MKNIFVFSTLIVLLIACNSGPKIPSADSITSKIDSINAVMKTTERPEPANVASIVEQYESFIVNYPEDERVPAYLEMQAKYHSVNGQHGKSLHNYERIYNDFPNAENRASALFMMAFMNEENMQDLEKAEKYYKQFITEFPEDDFVKDAQFSLEHMHMSDEELLEFLTKQQNNLVDEISE